MSRPLFIFGITALGLATLLFFPFVLETDVYYDMNKRKLGFSLYLFKFVKIIGGYIGTYAGGIAWHVSQKRAILIPYIRLESERKRFSFMKTFKMLSLRLNTETGAEYMLPVSIAHTVLRAWFLLKFGSTEQLENNFWLTDGDTLRIAFNSVVFFNIAMLLVVFFKFLMAKWRFIWNKGMKKSIS